MKKVLSIISCFIPAILLTACVTEMDITYKFDNGDRINVYLETDGEYTLVDDDNLIIVKKDGEEILAGSFIADEDYDYFVGEMEEAGILAAEPEEEPVLYVYQYESEQGTQIDFLNKIESPYAIGFTSLSSYEEARAAYDRLTITMVE